MSRVVTHLVTLLLAVCGTALAQGAYPAPADMQTLYIYFLNKGPNYGVGTADEQKAIQAGHMAHLGSLGSAGKIAGPFGTDGPRRGLVILATESLEAARAIAAADPAVKAGTFTIEIYTLVVPRNWFELGPVPEPFKMRPFVFVFLDEAPGRPSSTPAEMGALQRRHLTNLYRLSKEGKLHLAGPLADGGAHRGIGVLATDSIDEAQRWMADDPMVRSGHLVVVPLRWFAADGILLRR